jgi:hypothetical protein
MVVWVGRVMALLAAGVLACQGRTSASAFPWWRVLSLLALAAFFWTPWRVATGTTAVALAIVGLFERHTADTEAEGGGEILELVAWGLFIWAIRPL